MFKPEGLHESAERLAVEGWDRNPIVPNPGAAVTVLGD